MWAGSDTEHVVSETSTAGPNDPPVHSTEQVAAAPCDAGGVQTSTECSLKESAIMYRVVFATAHNAPQMPLRFVLVIAVVVALVETKRYLCLTMMLERNWGGFKAPPFRFLGFRDLLV